MEGSNDYLMWLNNHKPTMTGNGLYHLFMVIWGDDLLIVIMVLPTLLPYLYI